MSEAKFYALCGLVIYSPHAPLEPALFFSFSYFAAAIYFAVKK